MAEQRATRSARARAARIANQLTTTGRTRRTQEEIDADNDEDEAIAVNSRRMHIGLREALQDMVNKYQSEVIEPAAKIHKQEVEALNRRIKNSIHPAMPKTLIGSHGWSEEDEDSVLAKWETEKQYWVNVHDIGRYLNLWKICL
ncbi:hypothetical protein J3458_022121 [Metarhizium acridum]|uniref:uncharacterized protein n=1 Tax=Metarhizium acridum TaxID=92637 RepID=UPI001C6B2170|nr:hypothetical protein J3458_022121 [Metarhizium acridum]